MRRLIAVGAVIALLLLAAVPLASAGTTPTTKHVDGTVKVFEPNLGGREWLARFEIRTTSGGVEFGYLEMNGLTANSNAGEIHQYSVKSVDYTKT